MIVQCPRCSTRWRVADPATVDNPVFKCGRCHHVFPRFPGAPTPGERSAVGRHRGGAIAAPEPDNLEFIFPRRRDPGGSGRSEPATDALVAPLHELADGEPLGTLLGEPERSAPAPAARRGGDPQDARGGHGSTDATDDPLDRETDDADGPTQLDVDDLMRAEEHAAAEIERGWADPDPNDDERVVAEPARDGAPPAIAADQADAARGPRVLHLEDPMRRASASSGFRAANRAFFTLVAGFAALAIVVRADPDRAADWLAGVPIVGAAIGPQTTLGAEITLDNVQGGYERLRNDRTVFVIRGEAVNNSRGPVERIQVEGTLYSAAGEVDRKVISTGNETTLRLSELSESEIVLLQRFAPRTPLAPGERVPFSIVFLEPPRDLREFSSRVLSARPASSRAAGRPTDRGGAPAPVG